MLQSTPFGLHLQVCMLLISVLRPVGDCHYYAIVKKWTNLQDHAMKILSECPDLIFKVHYEDILKDKQSVVKGIFDFIGERRFGGIKRQASVMFMDPTEDLINGAKQGREAEKARGLSYQFQNLGRGDSFSKTQLAKWKNPVTGLSTDDLLLIESIAHTTMRHFGYEPHLVGVERDALCFSADEIKEFSRLNQLGIDEMNKKLLVENVRTISKWTHPSNICSFSAR